MNKILTGKFECIGRVIVFGGREDLVFTPHETELFTSLAPIKAGLDGAAAQQASGNRGFREGANERQAAEKQIRQDLRDITEIAKALHERGIDVGAAEAFRMPPNSSYARLAAAAAAFVDLVEPRKALFIQRGLAATFVEDLEARIAALGVATNITGAQRGKQVGGTAGLQALADSGMAIVRELRAGMRVKLRSMPSVLAEWTSIARVHRPAYGTAATTPPAEPPAGGSGS